MRDNTEILETTNINGVNKWRKFLRTINSKTSDLEASQSFLNAVRNCCEARQKAVNFPNFVIANLEKPNK